MRRLDGLAGRRLAATGGAAIALALFVGGGGCELEVGDTIPDFSCQPASPGEADPCPPDFICSTGTRKCVSAAAPCQPSCPSGMQCDRVTAQCTVRFDASVAHKPDASTHPDAADARDERVGDEGVADSGEAGNEAMEPEGSSDCRGLTCACAGASFCDSNLCSSMQTVTALVAAANNMVNFCTKPCCTSADCSPSTVCFAAGTGGNYCVSPAWIGRVAPLGASIGGAMCKVASDCRSGLCANGPNGTCADTCCSTAQQASQCAAGSICRFSTFPGNVPDTHYTAWCSPPGNGMTPGGNACGIDGVCASNRCGVAIGFGCESACRSSKDCPANLACTYTAGPFTNKDLAAGCVPMMAGNGAEGTACRANADCATNFCDTTPSSSGSMGHCSSVCFGDSDCTIKDWHCRPANVSLANVPYYILSCGTR